MLARSLERRISRQSELARRFDRGACTLCETLEHYRRVSPALFSPPINLSISSNRNTAARHQSPQWDYRSEAWARNFFENWRRSLTWQRLKPCEEFAAMIERHWHGTAACCKPENRVSLGCVQGLNDKIRVIQRRVYGLRHEEYLRLEVLTRMLPRI